MSSEIDNSTERIAIVRARWHSEIVDSFVASFAQAWNESAGGATGGIDIFDVPGALEIPLHAQLVASSGRYAAVVGVAFVVDGGIYRHDFVAGSVLDALVAVGLRTNTPVLSAVLTPHQFQDTDVHGEFFRRHFVVKGQEAASACRGILAERRRTAELLA